MLDTTDGTSAVWQFHYFALATVLAGGSGIRATLPLFLISLFHQLDPEKVPLSPETEWLGYWFICACLLVLLVLEIVADLVPAFDHALHTVLTPVHPVAGAIAAFAPNYGGGLATHVPMAAVGGSLALMAHGGKSLFRAHSTATTGGTLNPLASICGTLGVVTTIVLAIFVAFLSIILAMAVVAFCIYSCRMLRQTRQQLSVRGAALVAVASQRFRRGSRGARAASPEVRTAEPGEARTQPLVTGEATA